MFGWWPTERRLARLERAIMLILRLLAVEEREIEELERELQPPKTYPRTVAVSVRSSAS